MGSRPGARRKGRRKDKVCHIATKKAAVLVTRVSLQNKSKGKHVDASIGFSSEVRRQLFMTYASQYGAVAAKVGSLQTKRGKQACFPSTKFLFFQDCLEFRCFSVAQLDSRTLCHLHRESGALRPRDFAARVHIPSSVEECVPCLCGFSADLTGVVFCPLLGPLQATNKMVELTAKITEYLICERLPAIDIHKAFRLHGRKPNHRGV